jgi:hypothetical protein
MAQQPHQPTSDLSAVTDALRAATASLEAVAHKLESGAASRQGLSPQYVTNDVRPPGRSVVVEQHNHFTGTFEKAIVKKHLLKWIEEAVKTGELRLGGGS